METELLISFTLASTALAVSPGPDNIFVLIQSLTNGRLSGIAVVLGLMTGCLVHTTFVAFGVSALIKTDETLFFILKLIGACYLFFLAFKVWRSSAHLEIKGKGIKKSYAGLFKQGFIMNVVNPKVSVFFLAFFPGFLFSESLNPILQFYILGFIFMLVTLIVFSGIALLSGTIAEFTKGHKRTGLFFKWLQITVFIGIGIIILLSEK
ncbi:MAG: LysE family translocator [Flavobacteriaceae bacterium]|nr:LysE family translocator [Bacteroidia bacterium]MBT8288145.1 LysE family translocator [Bacteroidia bacterium]NNF74884.1 LysE family translocator [Flavobacteriaceae bacterium]NNK72303.1 LysE family translocator [Flavobacteriaceae bacterium]